MMQLILTIPILTATTRLLKTCPTLFLCMVDAIGSTLSPYVRTMYGERWMYPIIQVFVVAPPASGKGVVSWCRNFVEPEHERIRSAYKKEMKAYEKEKRIQEQMGKAKIDVETCWFDESEKLIKKVFTDYCRLCEKSKVKPILLFNEADDVFSKRKDVNSGSVAQTENAIQNIILEEMENLDGILIATTNLADNLDGAFERRFLFKIRFDKPTVEAKRNIWMIKLPSLSVEDAYTLASSYEFSGGQIDNIVRKALMQEVIKGEKPTLNSLVTMCSEEKISKNSVRKIGFC